MHKNITTEGTEPSPAGTRIRQRSILSTLFVISLGIVYPGFLILVFLKPELLEHLFNSSSGYLISGLGLLLLVVCFVLATLHFRSANRAYRLTLDNSPYPLTHLNRGDTAQHDPEP